MDNKGFTLIEIIVVMAVFLFVIGAALTVFISMAESQRRILSEEEILNQASYAEEYISKALRMAKKDDDGSCTGETGYIYKLTRNDASNFYKGIKFLNQSDIDSEGNPVCQEFYLDSDGILKERRGSDDPVAMTSSKLNVNYIRFGINGASGCYGTEACPDGASSNDDFQPRITLLFNFQVAGDSQEPERIIQTTVSQRNLNAE